MSSETQPLGAPFDSQEETLEHKKLVSRYIDHFLASLVERSLLHDLSKLAEPEKPIFDAMTPRLKACTYGSDEYKGFLAEMKVALDHHYANNRHHPEHFADGINGMTLVDLVEMICDWYAATKRHADGDIMKSIDICAKRFSMSEQLVKILQNTVRDMDDGWVEHDEAKK